MSAESRRLATRCQSEMSIGEFCNRSILNAVALHVAHEMGTSATRLSKFDARDLLLESCNFPGFESLKLDDRIASHLSGSQGGR